MLQIVDGQEVFVVEFDTMPALPITWNTPEEKPYALALQAAIQDGVITEPGKYGLAVATLTEDDLTYNVARIIE